MKGIGSGRDLKWKVVFGVLLAAALVPSGLQILIDGYQQLGSSTYAATIVGASSAQGCSCYTVTFTVPSTGQTISVLSSYNYTASESVSVVHHPALFWEPSYWDISTPGT